MTRISLAAWTAAAALAGGASQAETFRDKDGVVFEGTILRVVSEAAVCNVLEEKYSPEEYARLQANQGRPLHLWQVDFSIRNGSGRELDFLQASSWVRSEYPPCTNWSGRGPGGGPVRSEPAEAIPVQWADHLEGLSMPYGMRRDQEERSAVYVLAFDGQRPAFGEWDLKYTFAQAAGTGTEPAAGQPSRTGPEPACAGQPEGAACWMELANDPGCHVWNGSLGEGATAKWSGACEGGLAQGTGTLAWKWDSGEYEETGLLRDGQRQGNWVVRYADGDVREGPYADGQKQGRWVERYASGNVGEGPYADGQRQGNWVVRYADGTVSEGPYEENKRHGRWVVRYASGLVDEGPYADGQKQGRWVERYADGNVGEGPYADGQRQGNWVVRHADGTVSEGPYEENKRHGRWVVRYAAGDDFGRSAWEGPYEDGKKHGRWLESYAYGIVWEGAYVDWKMHSRWVLRHAAGRVEEMTYVDGKKVR